MVVKNELYRRLNKAWYECYVYKYAYKCLVLFNSKIEVN